MSEISPFQRHGLDSQPFSSAQFMQSLGERLAAGGLTDIVTILGKLGAEKVFLTAALSNEQVRSINSTEGLLMANEAASFQERVRSVRVDENWEPLIDLRAVSQRYNLPWTFTNTRYHEACGDWAGQERLFWIRRSVADGLIRMTERMRKADYGLHFEDGFRPLGVQEGLFKRRYQMAQSDNPEWTHDQIVLEAKSKTAYTPRFAAHKGGAAVDVRIRDLRSEELLDIGHDYPDGGALVALESPIVTQEQWQNRMLLADLALNAGMSMYPFEDWHICMGDTTAAACVDEETPPCASYGPIKNFDRLTGEILEVYSNDELDEVFEINHE